MYINTQIVFTVNVIACKSPLAYVFPIKYVVSGFDEIVTNVG